MNKFDKNTVPVYKIWKTTNIMPRLTGWTFIRVHWLHRTISWQISKTPHGDLWKSLKEYLAEAEVKPGEKSYTVIDHLAQELIPCKVTSSKRSRRINVYIKGTLLTVNVLILEVQNVSFTSCQVHTKGYQCNAPHNNITQNLDTNLPTETNRPEIDYKTRYPNLKPKSKAAHTYN